MKPSRTASGWIAAALLAGCAAAPPRSAIETPHPRAGTSRPAPARAGSYGRDPAEKLTPLEARAAERIRGREDPARAPRVSGALVFAARELARGAAEGARDPLSRARVRVALARALAFDPAPVAVVVVAPAAGAADAVSNALPRGRMTHLGVGAFERGRSAFVVVLASNRLAQLAPFPRDVAPGSAAVLAGTLGPGLSGARAFLTLPSGAVREVAAGAGRRFEARLEFPSPGLHAVEVISDGEGGPEVVALFTVSAGGAAIEARDDPPPAQDPPDDSEAEAGVVRAVNALRRRQGLVALTPAPELAAVARAHSAAMAAQGRVAHVLPGSGDAGTRLRRAGIPYQRVYENVARAATSLGAHEGIEGSPGHLGNLLRPDATRLGVGIARAGRPGGDPAVYLTELLVSAPDLGAESSLTPEGRVREALWRERRRLGLPELEGDPALDDLAREAASAMLRREAADPGELGDRALALRRGVAAVDSFVASDPGEATRSRNLRDGRFRRVGVGVTMGDSRRFGAGRFWIAVVYTD